MHIRTDLFHCLPQLSSIVPIACSRSPRKGADPLVRMDLEHRGPGSNNLPALASGVARGTDLIQPSLCRWEIGGGWQGTLAGRDPCAINVEDEPLVALPIPHPS